MAFALAPLLLLAAPAGAAPPITAEEAMRRYRSRFAPTAELDCPRSAGDIVVCGRTGPDPARSPIPYAREEGEIVRLLPGEPPSAAAALGADRMCFRYCEPPKGSILNVIKGIGHLLGKDD